MNDDREVTVELSIPACANPRRGDLSFSELKRSDYRCIGGDLGDLYFKGYDDVGDRTVLRCPFLRTGIDMTQDEVNNVAAAVLAASFASIGTECVEHS